MAQPCGCSQSPGCAFLGQFGALAAAVSVSGLGIPSVSLLEWGCLRLLAAGSGEEGPDLSLFWERGKGGRERCWVPPASGQALFQLPSESGDLAWEGMQGWLLVPLLLFPQPKSAGVSPSLNLGDVTPVFCTFLDLSVC